MRAKETKSAKTTSLLIIPGVRGVADHNIDREVATGSNSNKLVKMWKKVKRFTIFQGKREKRDKTLLVAASVIAAMAYQAAISPPGGSDEYTGFSPPSGSDSDDYTGISNVFWICNTISFIASLSVIFLYVSGATLKQRLFIWLIRAAMWITLTSMTVAYSFAVAATIPDDYITDSTALALASGLATWLGLIILSVLVLIYRSIRYIVRTNKKKRGISKKIIKIRSDDAISFLTPSSNIV